MSVRDEGRNAPEIKAHREVWPFLIYCVKVDDLLTVNDREKAVVGVGVGNPRLTISCIRKGERTFMPSAHTRLLTKGCRAINVRKTGVDTVNESCPQKVTMKHVRT